MVKDLFKRTIVGVLNLVKKSSYDYEMRNGFILYKYLKNDGTFDYEKYRKVQEAGNKQKINSIWVLEDNIEFLSTYIQKVIGTPRFGICHGTRRGKEQEWFRKYLNCNVIGTEISSTATQFPNTIQWDFHKINAEWINAVDFIYSNSFDHSYDPEMCLNTWMSCIRKGGLCVIEHTSAHGVSDASELDPFGSDIIQMPYLIAIWSKGQYGIREIINAPVKHGETQYSYFIIIQKF